MKTILIIATARSKWTQREGEKGKILTVKYSDVYIYGQHTNDHKIQMIAYIEQIENSGYEKLIELAREKYCHYYKDDGDSITFLDHIALL